MKDLGARSVTAVFWGGGGTILRIFLQFFIQIVLARVLGPQQYGLFAIGAIVVSFSNFFADFGIAYGLIQKSKVDNNDLRFVATWQFVIGAVVTVAVAAASPYLADFFGEDQAEGVIHALAVICLLNALAAPSLNVLKRELDFRRIQVAQLAAYVAGYLAVGLPLALAGMQVWALVVAWIVQSSVMLLILYGYTRHPIKPLFWYMGASEFTKYGLVVLATNITNWCINNIDRVIVGRVFAGKEIGLYATSYNMLYNPTTSLLGVVQPVFFSASARISDDKERIASGYRSLLGSVTLFVLPVFAGISVVSETLVLALYGPVWKGAEEILRPVALAMPLFLLWGLTTPLLWAGGKAAKEFKSQLPLAVLWGCVSWYAASISLAAVGWAVFAMFAFRYFVVLKAAIRLLDMRVASLFQAARGGLVLSALCAILIAYFDQWIQQTGFPPMMGLAFDFLVGLVGMLLLLRFLPGVVGGDVEVITHKIAARMPAPLAGYLRSMGRA